MTIRTRTDFLALTISAGAWRINRHRYAYGAIATAAVLMVAYQPADFTSAQAGAQTPLVETSPIGTPPGAPVATTGNVAHDPGCFEDQAAVVAPSDGTGELRWVCVYLDDWADGASLERLDVLLASR